MRSMLGNEGLALLLTGALVISASFNTNFYPISSQQKWGLTLFFGNGVKNRLSSHNGAKFGYAHIINGVEHLERG